MYDTLHYNAKMKFQTKVSKRKQDNKRKYGKDKKRNTPVWSGTICENEISNQSFKKKTGQQTQIWKGQERNTPVWSGNFFVCSDDCLLLLNYALVDIYFVCVTCLSLG